MIMPKEFTPLVKIGLLIVVVTLITDRFITEVPDIIVIPVLVLAIVLILIGGWKKKV